MMNREKITEVQINWNEWYFEDAVFREQASMFSSGMTTGVRFEICDHEPLARIADNMRIKRGLLPLWDFDDTGRECDEDSWYEFYFGINDWDEYHVDQSITVYYCNGWIDNGEVGYHISLSKEEQKSIYNSIDRQCRDVLGKGCEELLEEARKHIASYS